MSQDKLPALSLGRNYDFAEHMPLRHARVLDPDQALLEVHHQPLSGECVDANQPIAAHMHFLQGWKLQVLDAAEAQVELSDFYAVHSVAGRHPVENRGWGERELQRFGDTKPDDRCVGAAVDNELVRPSTID